MVSHTTHRRFMKSPFELRYDLLALATEHLNTQYQANVKFAQNLIEQAIAEGASEDKASKMYVLPKFPSIEDILAEAKKFYTFVDTAK